MKGNPQKKHFTFTIKDFWKKHKRSMITRKTRDKILDYHTYKELMWDFFAEIFHLIIWEKWDFVIPYKCGVLKLTHRHSSNMHALINHNETKKRGKYIQYTNKHSRGKVYSVKWIKDGLYFDNSKIYAYRTTSGTLAKKYGTGKVGIYEMAMKIHREPLDGKFSKRDNR